MPIKLMAATGLQGPARHNIKKFTRFKTFLPRIYKEFGGKTLD
jgi:hypothetical protein